MLEIKNDNTRPHFFFVCLLFLTYGARVDVLLLLAFLLGVEHLQGDSRGQRLSRSACGS